MLIALIIAFVLAVILAFSISANEEVITVTYNEFSGNVWETAKPNDDVSYT